MSTKRGRILWGIAVTFLIVALMVIMPACSGSESGPDFSGPKMLLLYHYPKSFEQDTLIVVGKNASEVELDSAQAIAAKLEQLIGNEPVIKSDAALTEDDKVNYNLILVGTPDSNSLLQEVGDPEGLYRLLCWAAKEYPEEWSSRGAVEILRNPWNEDKAMLLVAGINEEGVKAGSEALTDDEKIKQLRSSQLTGEIVPLPKREKREVEVVTAGTDELLGKYEKSDKEFEKHQIGDKIVYWHQRTIDDAIVRGDYIRYAFDKSTGEFLERDIHWREDLPEHLPPVISKEQAESMVREWGYEVLFSTLYFILPESPVFSPIKPTPKNPCWAVRTIGESGYQTIVVVDAVTGEKLGHGIAPP